MRRIRDVLRLKYEGGLSHRSIAKACGMGVGTVSEYVARAKVAGLGWPLPAALDEAALEARLFRVPAAGRERPMPDLASLHQESGPFAYPIRFVAPRGGRSQRRDRAKRSQRGR